MRRLIFLLITGLLLTNSEVLSITSSGVNHINTRAMAGDKRNNQQAIQDLLITLFKAADQRDWETAKSVMAPEVYIDYTALGGAAGVQTPAQIVTGWAGILPGFERTVHQIHNFAIWVAGDRATSTFDGIAVHYLQVPDGENYWTVFAGYDTEFIQIDGEWKLARIDLSLYQLAGNNDLPQAALKNVANNAIPELQDSSDATESVERFFQALEQTNFSAFLDNLSAEAVQEMPLAPSAFPKTLEGKSALEQLYSGVMDYEQQYTRTYFPTGNPQAVLVKFQGKVMTEAGKAYNNFYVNLFEVDEAGKIVRNVEHFNPGILLNSWTGLQPETYSVHQAGARTDGGVQMEQMQFASSGINLQGHLFLPPNFDTNAQYPAVVVTGSWTSVKEQMPDEYASLIAQQGFIALTFDFTGFGESEGQPRQVEDYELKINDIKAAIAYLNSHPNVTKEEITGMGVCASAGYMAYAAARDDRMSQLVLVAPWLHNPAIAKSIYDMRPGGTEGLLQAAKEAKVAYANTGEMPYVLAASELDPLSAMYVPENAFDYYLNPAKAAGTYYDNRFAVSSWEPWLTFDGISAAKEVKQPVLIVHSESGAVPQGAQSFYDQLSGEKQLVWLNAYNQQQLYHEAEAVNSAINQVVDYLKK
ncbi:MAG: nuclear transport factor 2 family protein [Bacteroidota bacterium]